MSKDDELTCMIHALQERCDELEARVSFIEDDVVDLEYEENNPEDGESEGLMVLDAEDMGYEGEIEDDEDFDHGYSAVRSPRPDEEDENADAR